MGIKTDPETEAKILKMAGKVDLREPEKNKFNATPVETDGKRFDSDKEGSRYVVLLYDQSKGKIRNLRHHVSYRLVVNGVEEGAPTYEADFVYEEVVPPESGVGWRWVVEDVKSEPTRRLAPYRMKKYLMKALFGVEISEV